MNLLLVRDQIQPSPECTLGMLNAGGKQFHTIERPWIPNPDGPGGHPDTSCIPVGTYRMSPCWNEKKGDHWILSNPQLGVYETDQDKPAGQSWGRTYVKIHIANWAHELEGCIAPGLNVVKGHDGVYMVTASTAAMDDLRAMLKNESNLTLTIENGAGSLS